MQGTKAFEVLKHFWVETVTEFQRQKYWPTALGEFCLGLYEQINFKMTLFWVIGEN